MFNFKKIWNPKKYVIVNCNFNGLECTIEASEVNSDGIIIHDSIEVDSFENLISVFGKNNTYWLHIEGSGVLTRIVDSQSDYKRDLIINGNPDDFYFTCVSTNHSRLVSFVRRTVPVDIVNYFLENKLFLVGLSCGFAPFGLLVQENKQLTLDYSVKLINGNFENLQREEIVKRRVEFDGEILNKNGLLARALFGSTNENVLIDTFKFENQFKENKEFNQFKKVGISSVTIIFIIVFTNYFYQNYLNNQVATKEVELGLNNSNLSILENLEQEELRKQQLVLSAGVSITHFISFYLDEIGKSVPKNIRLSELYAFPLAEKLKEKRKVEIDKTKIEITGWTDNNVILDDWIETIDRNEWVKSVELMNYQKLANDESSFKLIIFLAQ